jgi:hypothetical protein
MCCFSPSPFTIILQLVIWLLPLPFQ